MIPKECKRLAEVDFPIAVVSKHSAREKSIRHGHPSTLHLWWARRPLAACRAMLLALLWPDPCHPNCPQEFKERAREVLAPLPGKVGTTDEDLRKALLKFIGDFADWDRSTDPVYLEASRALVKAAYGDEAPLVVDPFAGGGSIPLEALRVGCEAFASDLNPVACLILKVMLEDIPRHGLSLSAELRKAAAELKAAAEKELSEFFPLDDNGDRPIAYLWARTVRCEAPNCGAEIPLVRSFWLSKKPNHRRALKFRAATFNSATPRVEFEVFEPKTDREVPGGTVTRARATCLCCNSVLQPERVRAQLAAQTGGADAVFDEFGNRTGGASLLAVVILGVQGDGRNYRIAMPGDYIAVWRASNRLTEILSEWEGMPGPPKQGLCPIPNEPTPTKESHRAVGSQIPLYGITTFGHLFTARQKLTLSTLVRLIGKAEPGEVTRLLLGLSLSRVTDIYNAQGVWESTKTQVRNLFSRQALPMRWDFAEASAFGRQAGDYLTTVETVARVGTTGSDFPCARTGCNRRCPKCRDS